MNTLASILTIYKTYLEKSLTNRFFKHADIEILIRQKKNFLVKKVGTSVEDRSIYLLERGTGEIKIFLWSQMHGDEATATMSLFDLLNFLDADDEFNPVRKSILEKCTLYFIPMVNPDGAEAFTRRNAQGLDINRDFLHQQTPEGRLLRKLRDEINPHFGFNLHDQSIRWSAGKTGNPATISLLAPAYDDKLSVNSTRKKAMQIIAGINADIQQLIPGHIARFKDDFEPRAFGDNFQSAGTSTILIEAGGYTDDREKQYIRKIYFASILSALVSIAEKTCEDRSIEDYFLIPENEKRHFSLIIRNCTLEKNSQTYVADIGLVADEKVIDGQNPLYSYIIEDVGDLSDFFCYNEVDAKTIKLILTKPLYIDEAADLILQDGLKTILSIENGTISDKKF